MPRVHAKGGWRPWTVDQPGLQWSRSSAHGRRQVRPGGRRRAGGWAARSSTPTRCSSTAGWTSAPPSSHAGERRGVPHHLLDVWDVTRGGQRGGLPAGGPGGDRPPPRRGRRRRCWSAVPGCTSARCSTTWSSPAPIPAVRARLEHELAASGPEVLHARLAVLDPGRGRGDPAEQRAPGRARAGGGRDHRGPSRRPCPSCRGVPGRTASASTSRVPARPADRRPGRPDVGRRAGAGGDGAGG